MDFNFTERLLFHQFRMAIRMTLSLSGVRFDRIVEILRYAAYQELNALGMRSIDMATHFDIAASYVTKLSRKQEPAEDEKEMLYVRCLDSLSRAGGHRMQVEELRQRALRDTFNPAGELEHEFTDLENRDFERALRYLERRGLLHQVEPLVVGLTPRGVRLVVRDLSRPYQRNTKRLSGLVGLATFLQLQDRPLNEAELLAAARDGLLPLEVDEVRRLLEWCTAEAARGAEPYLTVNGAGPEQAFGPPLDAWLTPNEGAEDKQATLINLVDELKAFVDWVTMDPPNEDVAVMTLNFRVLQEDLLPLLRRHRADLKQSIEQAEARARDRPDRRSYALSWFGRVLPTDRA